MTLEARLTAIKTDIESAITTASWGGTRYENGQKAKEALIRSSQLIYQLHEHTKDQFVELGVPPSRIVPTLGASSPELRIEGFLKAKAQDVCILPDGAARMSADERLARTICVNVRSQLSSLAKNFDTLYERTFAEALNLHLAFPSMVLGEVYLIPTHEYDDVAMVANRVGFKAASNVAKYVRAFAAINDRDTQDGDEYKYERVNLIIADFRQLPVRVYRNTADLRADGLLSASFAANPDLWDGTFAFDLTRQHDLRFG